MVQRREMEHALVRVRHAERRVVSKTQAVRDRQSLQKKEFSLLPPGSLVGSQMYKSCFEQSTHRRQKSVEAAFHAIPGAASLSEGEQHLLKQGTRKQLQQEDTILQALAIVAADLNTCLSASRYRRIAQQGGQLPPGVTMADVEKVFDEEIEAQININQIGRDGVHYLVVQAREVLQHLYFTGESQKPTPIRADLSDIATELQYTELILFTGHTELAENVHLQYMNDSLKQIENTFGTLLPTTP